MTLTKSGSMNWAGGGKSGALVDLWAASRFTTAPVFGSAPPDNNPPDAGPVITGDNFGSPGGYTIDVPEVQDYYVRTQYGGYTAWVECPAGSIMGQAGGGGVPSLTGIGDNGVTDNYESFVTQLAFYSALGAGEVILPFATGYYGLSQDLVLPAGMGIRGQGPFLEKSPGTVGTISFGSAFGPYVAAANSIVNGVIVLSNKGSWIENLCVVGINATNSTTYAQAANAAVYVTGSTTNQACRIRGCTLWGGLIAVLNCQTGSDSMSVENTDLNNSTFGQFGTSQQVVGSSPAGLTLNVLGAADIRFVNLETDNGPVQVGYNMGGTDIVFIGGHITGDGTNGTATVPGVFLSSGTGGSFVGTIFDNGSSNLLCHIQRRKGTWQFDGCRFQNGSQYSYPVFQSDIDTGNTSSTGDPFRGLVINGGAVNTSGNGAAHSCLVNYHFTTASLSTTPDNINGLTIDPGRVDAGVGTTNGSPVITDTAITSNDAGKSVVGPGIPVGAFVSPVGHLTPGTGYNLSSSSTAYVALNATATATVTTVVGPTLLPIYPSITLASLWQLNGTAGTTVLPQNASGIVYASVVQPAIPVIPLTGSGAPTVATSAGLYYFRTDTPSTSNQRLYVSTGVNTWVGIV